MPDKPINIISIPVICSGEIISKVEDSDNYNVYIYDSPMVEFADTIECILIYNPGNFDNYKQKDKVKVLICFTYIIEEERYDGVTPNTRSHILGVFTENSIVPLRIKNSASSPDPKDFSFLHPKTSAGLITNENGTTKITTSGSIKSIWKPFGHGITENMHRTEAMNHWRIISHNDPFYLSREHFGMYTGKDNNDKITKVAPEDTLISYRRFITQTKDPSNWVSSCEGNWNPWVGANNLDTTMKKGSKDVLFTKIVNNGIDRATVEVGEAGEGFFIFRIDKIPIPERSIPVIGGAGPAIVGNKLKIHMSTDGEIDIKAGGKGTPGLNYYKFHMSVNKDGKLIIHSSDEIELSHGDTDGIISSITMSRSKGIDIYALGGFRINGEEVVTKPFVDFFQKHIADLCLSSAPGSPSPMSPAAVPDFIAGSKLPTKLGGFLTRGTKTPATGIIIDTDRFSTVN